VNKAVTLILALLLLGGLGVAQNLATTSNKPGAVPYYSQEELMQLKRSDPDRYLQVMSDLEGTPPTPTGTFTWTATRAAVPLTRGTASTPTPSPATTS
jgi:hypothetical protein